MLALRDEFLWFVLFLKMKTPKDGSTEEGSKGKSSARAVASTSLALEEGQMTFGEDRRADYLKAVQQLAKFGPEMAGGSDIFVAYLNALQNLASFAPAMAGGAITCAPSGDVSAAAGVSTPGSVVCSWDAATAVRNRRRELEQLEQEGQLGFFMCDPSY